jgi:hypothetical protein
VTDVAPTYEEEEEEEEAPFLNTFLSRTEYNYLWLF